ncbi:TMV resistance protein N-like [Pistacia vera]|uniref:TMV resistance protein N-like n=1 Tax=Pistacia vera TaxID=55513 RepID=UPI001263A4EB|nr:TMV resistance protein N-like [Pistacia vera]
MASSSCSSSTTPKLKYKVFLSFRGEDTRENFTSHLYAALCQQNIATFIDNELIRGYPIAHSLSNTIEQSKISVVIFSEKYASSRWCLKELEDILACNGPIVIPVFYHVAPSDVRNQTGSFGRAFSKLEERFKDDSEMLQRWRTALRDAANLSGFHSKNYRQLQESELIKDILKKLNDKCSEIDKNLVGLDLKIEKIENLLRTGVCTLGIWGIGGIGKTTLVDAVFRKISKQKGLGRVLIVFDDVRNLEQMDYLMEDFDYSDSKSQIIITTRDEQVLKECGVDPIHIIKMEELSNSEACQLLNRYAFGENSPTKDYSELSSKIVPYAEGVPLTLKVLGASLLKRTKQDWERVLKNLKKNPPKDIHSVLKVSYDELDYNHREVFLDIACFLRGFERNLIEEVLDACGFASRICINDLIEKSLITTSSNIITMHDLLQEMGSKIIRQESANNPNECSKLWDHKEIYPAFKNNTSMMTSPILPADRASSTNQPGTCISLDVSKAREIHLQPKAFNKMHNLRFLEAYGFTCGNKVYGFEDFKSDFSELRYLCWYNYPAESLPRNFNPENLVALYMTYSKLKRLWTVIKYLSLENCLKLESLPESVGDSENLRIVILSNCSNIKTVTCIPCGVEALFLDGTAIEYLGGNNFESLPRSIKDVSKLYKLDLRNCQRLKSLPQLPDKSLRIEAKGCTSPEAVSGLPTQCLSMGRRKEEISFINCSI